MTQLEIEVENVGGIDEAEYSFDDAITLIEGSNASNKTSLLQSVLFALGGSSIPIRSGADQARVRLTIGDREVERTATRRGDRTETGGEAWVDDRDEALLVERFAALLGTNSLRGAVVRGDDIGALLKEPMDIDELERRRSRKMERKRDLERRIEELSGAEDDLREHTRKLERKRERVEDLEARVAELTDERDEQAAGEDEELEALREERADLRSQEADYTAQIEDLEAATDRLEDELADRDEEIRDAKETVEERDVEALEREKSRLQDELDEVNRRVDVLQSVLTANREMLNSEFTGVLGYESGLMGDEVTCWACGQRAQTEDFEETVEELHALVEEDKQQLREREPEIEALDERIAAGRDARSRLQRLESDQRSTETRLEERRDSLARKRDQLESVRDRLADLDEEIAERETEQSAAASDTTEEIESARVELGTVRREIERLEDRRETLRERVDERESARADLGALTEEIEGLTDRIENLEGELRSVFNEAMDDLLDVLAFERIERIWLDGEFELVVARESDGSVRRDRLDHLAESEREMIGLVLGLAGFITYDVGEVSPVLLLDSLGAFDAERTTRLVEYFSDRTDVLLAAVHPEVGETADLPTVSFERPVAGD